MPDRYQSMKEAVQKTILDAGVLSLEYFHTIDSLAVEKKSPKDLVTEADVQVELYLKERLLAEFPKFGFLGEESGQTGKASRWIVDPIDGTHSFVCRQYFWSISVALETKGEICLGAVYAPALGDLYIAEKGKGAYKNGKAIRISKTELLGESMVGTGFACLRSNLQNNNLERFSRIAMQTMGQRRYGSAALDLCLVADGQLDAYWEQHLNIYDVAAGALIAEEAGASITNFRGEPGLYPDEILATNRLVLDALLPLMD